MLDDILLCIHQKSMDVELLSAVVNEMERYPETICSIMRALSNELLLVETQDERNTDSDNSSSDSSSDASESNFSLQVSRCVDIPEEGALVFFRFGHAILNSLIEAKGHRTKDIPVILSAWTTMALHWCSRGILHDMMDVLRPFLVIACYVDIEIFNQTKNGGMNCLHLLIESVLRHIDPSTSYRSVPYDALVDILKESPEAFYTVMADYLHEPTNDTPIHLKHDQIRPWALLGNLVSQKWFDVASFVASSLWTSLLDHVQSANSLPFAFLGMWVVAMTLPHSPPTIDLSIVLSSLRQVAFILTESLYSSNFHPVLSALVHMPQPSNIDQTYLHLSAHIPLFDLDQVDESLFNLNQQLEIIKHAKELRPFKLSNEPIQKTFDDIPSQWHSIQQIEVWTGPSPSTNGDDGIIALRLTTHDVFGVTATLPLHGDMSMQHDTFATKHVLMLDSDERIIRIDGSCYDYPPSNHLPSRGSYIGALRFTTTKRQYSWFGKPSRQTQMDFSIARDRAIPMDVNSTFQVDIFLHSQARYTPEIIGLFGTFDDGMLRSLGANVIDRPEHRPIYSLVPPILGILSFIFRSAYTFDPWSVLNYFRMEKSNASTQLLIGGLFCQVRVHPGYCAQEKQPASFQFIDYLTIGKESTKPCTKESQENEPCRSTEEWKAKDWWMQREVKVDRELVNCLQKRMQNQRFQLQQLDKERHKWMNELKTRMQKNAMERNLSSEQNMELQEQNKTLKTELDRCEKDIQLQTAKMFDLQGQVDAQANKLNEMETKLQFSLKLNQEYAEMERKHEVEMERMQALHGREMENLKRQWRVAHEKFTNDHQTHSIPSQLQENEDNRFTELEKALKQRDQAIQSLKAMIDRQQSVSEEKLRASNCKYENAKAINLALQKRLVGTIGTTKGSHQTKL